MQPPLSADSAVTTIPSNLYGMALLNDPLYNKGSAFSAEERAQYGLAGLLPPRVETLEEQVVRAYEAFIDSESPLQRHIYLRQLQDSNEVLFYRLLSEHIEEMLPIVYTPTVGDGCRRFSHIYRRPRGLFVSYPERGNIRQILANRPNKDVDVIVVTDGERILGLGDQGAGGMGIPIGKLSLYTLIGGIHPSRTLPVLLDVGTNNPRRLADPLYIGWRHQRVTGAEYDAFVEQFISAVELEMPGVCLQWEDFAMPHARPLLNRYRDRILSFNDDVQGTAAVVLGAILAAINVTGRPLIEQQIVILGAGSAGIGVADYLRAALVGKGLSELEARARFFIVDKVGLLHSHRYDLTVEQAIYAQPWDNVAAWAKGDACIIGLSDVIEQVNATILIGLSTVGGAFKQSVVQTMARKVDRPIIFPLSNPTSLAEATPEDLMRWSDGRALVATGSPFAPVDFAGCAIPIAQCNNVFIFPAVGLALAACKATRVTDAMLIAAAEALGRCSPALRDASESLLPHLENARRVAARVALAVALQAVSDGVAPAANEEQLRQRIAGAQWLPAYS
ncbi:NAD-dependent malic enzyme [Candidatus Methylospira mobilis]|uniref:NAD-dependent malic enzyme n=1 Tax=Candidatus Methylospira mobilis TaxID=1808979 RepID=A0A5Q0BCI7_9GAMM|nr:NAD-dependent malic enzyme [Candidatus Methylospira mobilis]QFY41209.1 NAD-dependent malic enzyme [Candidatus Methylospira mobilis]WNV05566.1 NAD-dependent malic enzyme [Candidatus Methylospira mobilis]